METTLRNDIEYGLGIAGPNELYAMLWGIVVLFLSLIGPILYLVIARPQLLAVQSRDL